MANYKLYPKSDVNTAVIAQKLAISKQFKAKQFNKDTKKLEETLNDFFYKKNSGYQQYYDKAIQLAKTQFEEKYSSYNFSPGLLTANFKNPNIQFINKDETNINKVQKVAQEISNYMTGQNLSKPEWQKLINEINNLQSLSNWDGIKDLNGIIASLKFGNKSVYGDAFEYPLAAFATLLEAGAEETVENLKDDFAKHIKGSEGSKTKLSLEHVSKKDRKDIKIKNTHKINEGLTLEYSNPSKDKLDVSLIFEGTEFNISAKSYRDTTDIHILGGAALTIPVINLSSVDFVSHYLTQLYDTTEKLNDLHTALRLNILFMALTGVGTSGDKNIADVFVLNDKAKKRIYVKNMGDLINTVIDNPGYLNINDEGQNIPDKGLRNYRMKNIKSGVIGSMISEMHKIKLYVSIKGAAVKQTLTK